MNKKEILNHLQTPGLYLDEYLVVLDWLKRSELIELAKDFDAPIRFYYSTHEIKKSIVFTFVLPRYFQAVREMSGEVWTKDDIPNQF